MPKMFIIAGCNGAGKTTASYTLLPELLDCKEFINSDEIAKGLSPFNPSLAAIKASKLMAERMDELLERREDFGIETTLSTKSLARIVVDAQRRGYMVSLVFLWLSIPELAIERVRLRVESGGHDIPEATIRRRYASGIDNLFKLYMPICDYWVIIDNSGQAGRIVAEGGVNITTKIHSKPIYNSILEYERTRD